MYSAEPIRPHHGSSRSRARLAFHTVGSLKFDEIVSTSPTWLLLPVGMFWWNGSGLNGAVAGSYER